VTTQAKVTWAAGLADGRRAELLEAYHGQRLEKTQRALRLTGAIVALIFLADGGVALLTRPGMFEATFWTRVLVGLYALACALGVRRVPRSLAPALAVALGIGVAVDTAAAAAATGGLQSPWIAGEFLLPVAASLLLPLAPIELALLTAAIWMLDLGVIAPTGAHGAGELTANLFLLGVATSVAGVATVTTSRLRLREYLSRAAIEAERARSERLLLNILPGSIAERLKQGEEPIADACGDVTVLFADIVQFTEFAAGRPAGEVVLVLNQAFSTFDDISTRHGLEKIKTIGDAYMAVAGLPEARPDHAGAAARMALDMLAAVRTGPESWPSDMRIRIGLHTGPVVAGVIGARKFTYDLWGDTVNVASRMESHGAPNRIQVSEETHRRLAEAFDFEERGMVEVKGRGPMRTYWLLAGSEGD
jgi:class 3 adenylate cyclase